MIIKSNIINNKRDIEDVKRSVEFTDGEASDLKKKVNVIEGREREKYLCTKHTTWHSYKNGKFNKGQ